MKNRTKKISGSQDAQNSWPRHADGRNKKVGEMTRAELRKVFRESGARLKEYFKSPKEVLNQILSK